MALIRNNEKMKSGLKDFIEYIKNFGFDTRQMTILEIGTFNGESTEIFADNFGKVITVDPYNYEMLDDDMRQNDLSGGTIQDIEKGFVENVLNKHNNIIKIKKESLEYVKESDLIDIVYIDASHEYENVIMDIKAWLPKCKMFISGHDYLENKPGVIHAIAEVFGQPDKIFQDHSWIVRIK
jgi:hypothetical protein